MRCHPGRYVPGDIRQAGAPGPDEIAAQFRQDRADIQPIADYFLTAQYESIYIQDTDESMFADFSRIPIDESIKAPVLRLIRDRNYHSIDKHADSNALQFSMWTDHRERDCGVVYAIDPGTPPEIQFRTRLEPMPEDGWYYYVSDYNQWRNQ